MPEQAASGRRKRRRGRLSRELVLATALALVDREGLSALSMRRLAAELGVEAMALYRYAAGKDALLDGLVEAVFTEFLDTVAEPPVAGRPAGADTDRHADQPAEPDTARPAGPGAGRPAGPDTGWRAELHRAVREMHRTALRHPHVVPLLATRMLAVPLARRPPAVLRAQEHILAPLVRAGFDDDRTQLAYRAVIAWALGYVFVELTAVVDDPDEPEPAIRLGLHRMPVHELPHLRAVVPALAERGGEEVLAAGLDAVLDRFLGGAGREAMT
ncbi:TetR/AcrR family transcriptional regulator [Streptomyces sp. WAC05374]|uniref:TetR/AcrR family transcriptional regulator n=1 Tax=Streptomyces sp. WAC05374 TaxID=2487420 RepID=UPI000F888DCB|nr:TetR/AcrR family transcriptional regulator [Streptomyces sp. WAC05374]RST10312.1 TetR/AcrR family transcriptional regulator [Streptomyces sp. WAC05374]TDF50510.1 TetR/AcrR family transcriptional regulator [Streptomyces sp. WAC05374]TDF56799.1 TetR/AcrR family transcriptional regulator [Streptomyces sp. WAC05374]TDF60762.1 TetR/AcrR family transcriptional regulator [Streptomyces sp. WAC05374]